MDTLDLKERMLDRVAKLVAMNVSQKQIAQACGVSEGRISQITATDDFRSRLAEIQSEDLEQADETNRGWDMVENLALGHVLENMQLNPDPEFALRVAAQANKAARRGGLGNQPINGKANATATITLNIAYIGQLKADGQFGQKAIDATAHRVDALPLQDVENLLQDTFEKSISDIFTVSVE